MRQYEKQVAEKLRGGNSRAWCVCVGFDGYIDTLCRPVAESKDSKRIPFSTIREFGEYLTGKAGKSCAIDLIGTTVRPGGNAPLFAGAISGFAPETRLIGCLGQPERRKEFSKLLKNVRCASIGEPGLCTALEFDDGKIMLADNSGVQRLDFCQLIRLIPKEELIRNIEGCELLALMNWSELPGMTDIWQGILNTVPANTFAGKRILIDVSDCSCRCTEDILRMLDLIKEFAVRAELLFSMNENESLAISEKLNIRSEKIEDRAARLREALGGIRVSIHSVYGACLADENGCTASKTRHIDIPKVSTGAGDHFNAGLAYAWMEGYSAGEMLTLANYFSSCYVADGCTPTRKRLVEELLR